MPIGVATGSILQGRGRSTVVTMLVWMFGVLMSGLIGCVRVGAPSIIVDTLAVLAVIDFVTFIGLYIYFSFNNLDALRSETYGIQKMAIEHRLLGDANVGLRDIVDVDAVEKSNMAAVPRIGDKSSEKVPQQ